MGRGRDGEELVREGEVAPELPLAARRPGEGHHAGRDLRRPRLLTPLPPEAIKAAVAKRAASLGFDLCRVAAPDAIPEAPARLAAFLAAGHHGGMAWLAGTDARRADPRVLWPDVRSVVMLGLNYGPDHDPRRDLTSRSTANVSVYARNRDYHDLVKGRLKEIASVLLALARRGGAGAEAKVFVDTAPVMEKPLAAAAGLGWQGKHTNLVSRGFGSWLFLGSLFTTVELPRDEAEPDRCGSCRACLAACPTDAFPAPYRLDARRCISYLTIEHQGAIPLEFRRAIGNRVYGCDDCLAACPWNKYASEAREAKLRARPEMAAPPLADWLALDEDGFRSLFVGSPVKRLGLPLLLRNLLVAAGNSGDPTLLPAVRRHIDNPSAIVRETAAWALAELLDEGRASAAISR